MKLNWDNSLQHLSTKGVDNFPKSASKNSVDDYNSQFKSISIDMDLAKRRAVNSPRGVTRQQKPFEFEFSAMPNTAMKGDVYEPAMEVASADKLFFKGQLLPLQQDSKLQLVQALTCPREEAACDKGAPFAEQHASLFNFQFPHESCPLVKLKDSHEKCDSDKGLLMMYDNDDSFTMHCESQAAYNPLCPDVHEERFAPEFSSQKGFDFTQPCRIDNVFNLLNIDSRSSSFCSHQSSYWSSGEKESRNSSSSSRYSNGSYHDTCLHEPDRKALHMSRFMAKHADTNVCTENECDICVTFRNTNVNQCCVRSSRPPICPSNSGKWSWKGLFTVLKRASKLWADGERGNAGQVSTKLGVPKNHVFTFEELPCAFTQPANYYRRSTGHNWEWQTKNYQFVRNNGGPSKTGRKIVGRDGYEEAQIGTIFHLRSKGRQEASFHGGTGDCGKRERGKMQGNVWKAKQSWNRCANKVKKGTKLLSASKGQRKQIFSVNISSKSKALLMGELEGKEVHVYRGMKIKSLSSTPLAKSPVRRPEYSSNNNPTYGGASLAPSSSSSMKNNVSKKVGFASCPASMRSSPHHSGLLAVMNKATPDLHTAIQGAIAHCKQSQGS